jgi:hypothetical protein
MKKIHTYAIGTQVRETEENRTKVIIEDIIVWNFPK